MRTTYQITEYGSFVSGREIPGYTALPESTFKQLESFILANNENALEIMGLSAKRGIGKVITAKNYIGIITMKDGTTIEILPKIYSQENYSATDAKKLVIKMLKTLHNSPFKNFQTSNLNIEKMSIFEIFIRMFIDEVFCIVKRGLKCSYETVQSNGNIFKGKIIFSEQIKHNYAHKERAFVEYDEFNCNSPENKLLKSTLVYLYRQTTSSKNKNDIKTLLSSFTEVDESTNYKSDFSKYIPDRNMNDYSKTLIWCKVFLQGKSFTSFAGSEVALALLFPMESLFESYIAVQIKKVLGVTDYTVSAQDKTYSLFDTPKKFSMRPDIVITSKSDNVYVLDTKWKVLSEGKNNYGISQADMYQMYAYQKKYNSENVTLLYPITDSIQLDKKIEFISNDGVTVKVKFIDLFNVRESLEMIIGDIIQ